MEKEMTSKKTFMSGASVLAALLAANALASPDPVKYCREWQKTTPEACGFSAAKLAKIGELMLRKGAWNGKQLIPADWVEESTQPVTKFPEGGGYGYMWCLEADDQYPDACRGAFAAHGVYGQRIAVFPALDMVVAHKSARNKACPTKTEDYRDLIRLIFAAHVRDGSPSNQH